MALLARLGRYRDGAHIADSLARAGALDVRDLNEFQLEGLGWAYTLFLMEGRFDQAGALLDRTAAALTPAAALNPELPADALALVILSGYVPRIFASPPDVRATALEQLLANAGRLPPDGAIARLLPFTTLVALQDRTTPDRPHLAERALAAARALADSGRADLAFALAASAATDSVQRRGAEGLPWFVERRRAARVEQTATQRRFRPGRAVVTDSSAVFAWAVDGERFRWSRLETPIGESDFQWTAEFDAGGKHYEVLAHLTHVPGAAAREGGLGDLLGAAIRVLHDVSPDSAVPHATVRSAQVRLEQEPGGFRMVLRDPTIVSALTRERPRTARLRFRPCPTEPAEAAASCVDQLVPLTYP
jgi:hypothetical protein